MGLTGKLRELRWRAAGHYTRPLPERFTAPLRDAELLEVGGPSALFHSAGLLPVYSVCRRIDNCQFSANTIWHDLDENAAFEPEEGAASGTLHIGEGADLGQFADGRYDAVVSSHVIEHFANPLGALAEWRRVTKPGGHLLLNAPHMAGTFDHRRPVTTLEHIKEDFRRGTPETDLTHLEESLALHDRSRDVPWDTAEFERQRRNNHESRVLHHHVFTARSLLEMLDAAGLELRAVEVRFPHDIYVLGQWVEGTPDNERMLGADPPYARSSPFRVDRARAAAT